MTRWAFPLCRPHSGPQASNVSYLGAARCRQKFELYYPGGFADSAYVVAERAPRERAHLEWQQALGAAAFGRLIAQGRYRDIAALAMRVEARTHLLSPFEKMALRDALRPAAGARRFAHGLYAFLHGRGSAQQRFESWTQVVQTLRSPRARVLTWPVVTVFGFLARPERHLLLKPQATRKAAGAYGFDLSYTPEPAWPVYASLLTFGAIIGRDLARYSHLRPRDMIDVQSFIWVQGAHEYEA